MIAIAIQRPGGGHAQATVPTNLNHAFLTVTNIVFGYGELGISLLRYSELRANSVLVDGQLEMSRFSALSPR